MGGSGIPEKPSQLLEEVIEFVKNCSGLSWAAKDQDQIVIQQSVDGKSFKFKSTTLEDVLKRMDSEGKPFIQINFVSGFKVLITDTLVGFKPRETTGLDMTKLPKVVTTPDLISVFDAIEESMSADTPRDHEVEILKKVYQSILQGGELAGFDLEFEKRWLSRLLTSKLRASA